jgi:D-cysteine desulfhydrase
MHALGSHFPGLQALPCEPLTDLPTPLDNAPALASKLEIDGLFIKRDDLSATLYGGNKVRKLDFLFADTIARGCDGIVTFGAAGSNHALATAIYARQLNLSCYAVLTDQPVTAYAGAALRYHHHLGTKLVAADGFQGSLDAAARIRKAHPSGPDRLGEITWGGSSWLGAAGFVNAALELVEQLGDAKAPQKIYVACGTMGTAVGLALGLRVAGVSTQVVAVQVVPEPVTTSAGFEKLFRATNRELHQLDRSFPIVEDPLGNVDLRTEFLGDGYAIPTAACLEAMKLIEQTEGLRLEPTYTAKALAALVQDARDARLAGGTTLFWQTYNSPPNPPGLKTIRPDSIPAPVRK